MTYQEMLASIRIDDERERAMGAGSGGMRQQAARTGTASAPAPTTIALLDTVAHIHQLKAAWLAAAEDSDWRAVIAREVAELDRRRIGFDAPLVRAGWVNFKTKYFDSAVQFLRARVRKALQE
jgi:hypothetical protein